jgi:sigma-B regulation protein RsbU (phosphoserine phosphatase)
VVQILSVGTDITDRKNMEDALRNVNDELNRINTYLAQDVRTAARIQESILPDRSQSIAGVEHDWYYRPSEALGGDIFDIFSLDEDHVGVYVLDVSGHGVSAALLSVVLSRLLQPAPKMSSLLKRLIDRPPGYELTEPPEVAERLNAQFQLGEAMQQFFTMIYGILDLSAHEFRYVAAGHPGLIHLPRQGEARLVQHRSFPIGVSETPEYQVECLKLNKGDRIYLYTDGVTEAQDTKGRAYGESRLVETINQAGGQELSASIQRLQKSIHSWQNGTFEDDITVLGWELRGFGQ